MPTLHVLTNSFDYGESRLDHVGAGQCLPQFQGNVDTINRQRFFQSFAQAARRARIQIHQFAMQSLQRLFGRRIVFPRVSLVQLSGHQGLVLVAQVIQNIAPLVNLAVLNQRRLASIPLYSCVQEPEQEASTGIDKL
jgi:hypothetical protein